MLIATVGCRHDRDIPLHDIARGFYPRDSVFTVSGNLQAEPGVPIPFTRTALKTLTQGPDTVGVIVPECLPVGSVRLHVRAYDVGILSLHFGRIVVAVDDSAARKTPSRSK